MKISDPIAERATALLLLIPTGDADAVQQYDTLLFPLLRETGLRRGRLLAANAGSRFGAAVGAGPVQPADLEEVAVVAAQVALRRARASALRFDPRKGDGATWALGALGGAYLDAIRQVTRSRRIMSELPLADVDAVEPYAGAGGDPYTIAEARDSLRRALDQLDDDERYVVVAALQYGLSYREIALYHLHDEGAVRQVERILGRARRKLRAAHEEWLRDP